MNGLIEAGEEAKAWAMAKKIPPSLKDDRLLQELLKRAAVEGGEVGEEDEEETTGVYVCCVCVDLHNIWYMLVFFPGLLKLQ